MKNILILFSLLFSFHASALDPAHFTITRVTAPYFIVDGNSPTTITSAYVGFEVRNNSNSATTYPGLRLTIASISTSVSGQNFSVVSPASGIVNIGTLAPGESKVCYYYVSYPASVTPEGTFNLVLSDNTATSKSQSILIRNRSSISANAGGTATQSISNQDLIGGIIADDVTYVVGNVQNGDENDFQVAVSTQFDPTKVTLLSTQVITSAVPGITVGTTDSLYFITGNGSNGATITIRWIFRITGYNFTTYLLPCAGATSGSSNYKYALNTALGSGTAVTVSASANPLTITKTSDKTIYGINSPAIFTITIQNPGAYGVTIDKITDQLPTGFTFQSFDASSGITASNSTLVPSNGATGTINFEGSVLSAGNTSYYIPAGGSIVLKYTALSGPATAYNLSTTVVDYIGTTQVGTAQNTVSVTSTLPVNLVSFRATTVAEGIKLEWTTANESNSSEFELERSTSGNPYTKIGSVAASGTVSTSISYSFVDSFPAAGANHYRLKMIDQDQSYKYSKIVSATVLSRKFSIENVYPNPLADFTNVYLALAHEAETSFGIFDMQGVLVWRKNVLCSEGNNLVTLDNLGKLKAGSYVLRVSSGEGSIDKKLIKLK